MTFDQFAIVTLLVVLLAVFAIDRFRLEAVAFGGLVAAFLLGLVPADGVFAGFAHPAVITVVEILILVQALQDTHVLDAAALRLTRRLKSRWAVVGSLCATGAFVSAFMNNVGALALMFPIAVSMCARAGVDLRHVLMPLSFATLLGGTCSLIGTPANLIVAGAMFDQTGDRLAFFDLGKAGLPAALAGLAVLVLWPARRFARPQDATSPADDMDELERGMLLVSEYIVPAGSTWVGHGVDEAAAEVEGRIHTIVRGGAVVFSRKADKKIEPGDILLVEGAPNAITRLIRNGALCRVSAVNGARARAVVTPGAVTLGSRIDDLESFAARGITVESLHTAFKRIEGRFGDLKLAIGDVLVLTGPKEALAPAISDADLLVLDVPQEAVRQPGGPVVLAVFAAAVVLIALAVVPPEIGFGLAVAGLAITGRLDVRAAVRGLNWPIVLMLAAMIPLGEAVHTTGAAAVIATNGIAALPSTAPLVVCGAMLIAALVLTPFVNNATAAVILSPIAVEISRSTGTPLEALLTAVALGVSLDFLTPFGHHNNTIVMGAAGYRFADFPRLGAPVVLFGAAAGLAAIAGFWLS